MQRLFTIFPNGVPGVGLLLLRCCAGLIGLGHYFNAGLFLDPRSGLLLTSGALLSVGLWTPIAAVAFMLASAWIMGRFWQLDAAPFAWFAIGVGLAMLGPGARSIDSRLFGRKRIDLNPRPD